MGITKVSKTNMEITADYQKTSDLNVAFYNQDVNTAILQFNVTRNNAPVPLGKSNVDGYIVLLHKDGSRIQDNLVIEDEEHGVIQYTIPREFLKHTGKVLGQIYISVKGKDDTAVMRQFSFDVKNDLLTGFSAEKKLEYIKMFDDLQTQIKQRVEAIEEAIALIDPAGKMLQEIDDARTATDDRAYNSLSDRLLADYNALDKKSEELKNKKMDKTDLIKSGNLSQEVKEMMTGGSVAVVGDNTVLTNNIVDKQVTRKKTNLYSDNLSSNLFDKNEVITGGYYNYSTGAWVKDDGFVSMELVVKPGEKYLINTNLNYFFTCFDTNKKYLSGGKVTTFVTPENAKFLYVTCGVTWLDNMKINKDVLVAYEPPKYSDDYLLVKPRNLDTSIVNNFMYNKATLVAKSQGRIFNIDAVGKKINFSDGLILYTSSYYKAFDEAKSINYPTVDGLGTYAYIFYDKNKDDFVTKKPSDFLNREINPNIIYVGVFDESSLTCDIDVVDSSSVISGQLNNMSTDHAKVKPTINYKKKSMTIHVGTWFVAADNYTRQLTITKPQIINYTDSFGYFIFDTVDEVFLIVSNLISFTRDKGRFRYVVFGFFNENRKVTTFNGDIKQSYYSSISILGDSISTYVGWIPDGNRAWYPQTNDGVVTVDNTWWHELVHGDYRLCVNNSWSGSRVTNTQSENSGALTRVDKLHANDDTPEVVIVAMGTNDFANNVPIGDFAGIIDFEDDKTFANTYARVLDGIYKKYGSVKIYCMTLGYVAAYQTPNSPLKPNTVGLTTVDYNNAIKNVAKHFNIQVIDLGDSGLNSYNPMGGTHPNRYGHKQINLQVRKAMAESQY